MPALVEAGSRVGRYLLTRRLGMGGFAEVWEGDDEDLRRKVAVKLALPALCEEPEFIERFLREARAAASLDHRNILAVYEFGTHEGRPFLVMPVVPGGSLASRLTPPPPLRDVLRWLGELAAALDHAHEGGVIHRDVKPQNVLFDRKDRLLLTDFGIAKSIDESTALTQTGAAIGTPAYMSPEQALGHPEKYPVGPAADQYALGVLAYRMLTARFPFDGPTFVLLRKAIEEPPPPPSTYRPDLSPEVDAVFGRVLAKRAADRFESCEAFVTSLTNVLAADAGPPRAAGAGEGAPPRSGVEIAVDGTERVEAVLAEPLEKTPRRRMQATGPRPVAGPATLGRADRRGCGRSLPFGAVAGGLAAAVVLGIAGIWLIGSRPKKPAAGPAGRPTVATTTVSRPTAAPPAPVATAAPVDAPAPTRALPTAQSVAQARPTPAAIAMQDRALEPMSASAGTSREQVPVGVEWIRIPAGRFTMGCAQGDSECQGDEKPPHAVVISKAFQMAATETTNAQYRKCVDAGVCEPPQGRADFDATAKAKHPVVDVDWNQARTFCVWAGGRLPTEAEWEYAARGRHEGWRYVWGDQATPMVDRRTMANVADESARRANPGWRISEGYDDGFAGTSPVKSFPPNGFGLYDMAGNVWEWCSDRYDEGYYGRSPAEDPKGPSTGAARVSRGGSWGVRASEQRISLRVRVEPGDRYVVNGFRCAMEAPGGRD